ncbi:MAG TPA: class I SAM-dependent methyltransferase [Solirubrobacteraceae bacterium]|jgi:predicted O-methyltransferase YrrM
MLPAGLRRSVPVRVRDDVRLRALALASGLIPPRGMHSEADLGVLREAARGAARAVEIGVYEGASALALMDALGPGSELHLIDPFGHHPDALPSGWGASERATKRTVARHARRLGALTPRVSFHVSLSRQVALAWGARGEVDFVFIDGDHSEHGCEQDWVSWSPLVSPGGRVVFHDARVGLDGGRGLPGPSAVVARLFDGAGTPGWRVVAEADRTVAVRREA